LAARGKLSHRAASLSAAKATGKEAASMTARLCAIGAMISPRLLSPFFFPQMNVVGRQNGTWYKLLLWVTLSEREAGYERAFFGLPC
jgi:hypothetical protein